MKWAASLIPRAVLLLALLTLSLPAASPGQMTGPDSTASDGINGYHGISWGADSAAIVRSMGAPDTVRRVEAMDARALIYSEHRLGNARGSLGFLIHPTDGLLRAMYLAEYASGEACLTLYQHLRDEVSGMLSSISTRERMYNESEDLSFCTAFQLGQAGGRTIWRDRETGARAWVALDLEAGVVRVSFESPRYRPRDAEGSSGGSG